MILKSGRLPGSRAFFIFVPLSGELGSSSQHVKHVAVLCGEFSNIPQCLTTRPFSFAPMHPSVEMVTHRAVENLSDVPVLLRRLRFLSALP